jgi:hypothetical protein
MIVIPMAGRSQRFVDAGYDRPKFMLELEGRSVFDHAVGSFAAYFDSGPFVFITSLDAVGWVTAEVRRLGIHAWDVVGLDQATAGQAETVELGLGAWDGELTIFNIDTFRPGFRFPGGALDHVDGWLEVFRGGGTNWSYVRPSPGPEPLALETAEKKPISDLCCTGLYHFQSANEFRWALDEERRAPQAAELYVAPLYNHLIRRGARIGYSLIGREAVVFCGTPAEYEGLLSGSA